MTKQRSVLVPIVQPDPYVQILETRVLKPLGDRRGFATPRRTKNAFASRCSTPDQVSPITGVTRRPTPAHDRSIAPFSIGSNGIVVERDMASPWRES